jgi:hypothetical protein
MGMLRLEHKTRLSQEKIIGRLKRYFGKEGLGLDLTEESAQCLTFTGGGGYVTASLCQEGDDTRVDLITQEWEYHVRQFAGDLG